NGGTKNLGLIRRDDPRCHIVGEREHCDSRLADGEGRSRYDRWEQALESLPGFWQLCGDARRSRMYLRTNVMGDEPHDSLAIGGSQSFASVRETFCESVDPQATVRIEHDLDDSGVLKPRTDHRPERAAQHPCTARCRLRSE